MAPLAQQRSSLATRCASHSREEESRQVKVELSYKGPLIAPVKKGTEIGKVRFLIEGKPVAEQAVVTGQDIAAVDSRWKRALDSLIIMALGG